ncbi:hypothetical protein DPMN_178275 [Dreissena polymorpha]|uniref:Uncharacterized protein n=1 Tax=Dreissena polymorpha TaxID=45954 RepID=A0A9D4III7_DREPO|nr:hypothetical protein DPMN_178275 [Dreissena polymorpha]
MSSPNANLQWLLLVTVTGHPHKLKPSSSEIHALHTSFKLLKVQRHGTNSRPSATKHLLLKPFGACGTD